jgi:hypothetical protein
MSATTDKSTRFPNLEWHIWDQYLSRRCKLSASCYDWDFQFSEQYRSQEHWRRVVTTILVYKRIFNLPPSVRVCVEILWAETLQIRRCRGRIGLCPSLSVIIIGSCAGAIRPHSHSLTLLFSNIISNSYSFLYHDTTIQKFAGSRPDEVKEFFFSIYQTLKARPWGLLSL